MNPPWNWREEGETPIGPHDEFLELCALSTAGQLSEEEQNRLQDHLAVCSDCREALRQYESVVEDAIPTIGAGQSTEMDPGPGWSQSKAEKAFFERLSKEGERQSASTAEKNPVPVAFRRVLPATPESTWRHVWMLYAAGVLLFVTLCFSAYRIGVSRGTDLARSRSQSPPVPSLAETKNVASLEEQLSDTAYERELARDQIIARDKSVASLRRQLQRQALEIARMKAAQGRLEANLQSDEAGRQDLVQQRADLLRKLEVAQSESQAMQHQVDLLTQQSLRETAQANSLSTRVDDLTHLLQDRDAALNQRDELLAHDRDIRELIGARNLYITEVYDTDEKGATRKPYGRVFYTKEKSLVFYAYDLDQQGGERSRTFQAWGRRGPDWKQAVNLGIFYEDNASKKRWVLKSQDPKTLAQIDAVFITVEPHGGSDKPSGKPLLFAYFNTTPNHP